jgi:type IV pilus assembly protein PilA
MLSLFRKRVKGEKGFTLIELLVVIIIIAILAAIAIPTFLGQRQKAQDTAAKSLVRNAMTAIESAYVDFRSFDVAELTEGVLEGIEPSIDFVTSGAIGTPATDAPGAVAEDNEVAYYGAGQVYSAGTLSESGTAFGVIVNKSADETTYASGNTYYIGGEVSDNWATGSGSGGTTPPSS